ncbi:MAG: outer membrane protein assembly factor BamE [Gammaproteobacteria bacterium]|nr:outer membrane protein assembly factor BamE [Gammaproteobacteria bacterium]
MKTKIITFLSATCIVFTLTACTQTTWLYRVNVQQGNIVTADMIHQLHLGMTKDAVTDLIGPPVLMDTFNDNRWTYIYTYKPGRGKYVERRVVIYFKNDRISHLSTHNI